MQVENQNGADYTITTVNLSINSAFRPILIVIAFWVLSIWILRKYIQYIENGIILGLLSCIL